MSQRATELRARCDEKHVTALRAIAKIEGVPPTEALRLLVRDRARELNVWPQAARQAQGT